MAKERLGIFEIVTGVVLTLLLVARYIDNDDKWRFMVGTRYTFDFDNTSSCWEELMEKDITRLNCHFYTLFRVGIRLGSIFPKFTITFLLRMPLQPRQCTAIIIACREGARERIPRGPVSFRNQS